MRKASREAIESGDVTTVNFETAIERLTEHCGIDFGKTYSSLKEFNKLRNRIEHYNVELSELAAISQIVNVWSFLLEFCHAHLDELHDELVFDQIREKVLNHEAFVRERMQRIQPEIDQYASRFYILRCPRCLQKSIPLTTEKTTCSFCLYEFTAEGLETECADVFGAETYDFEEKWHAPITYECPTCEQENMYLLNLEEDQANYVCFSCGENWDSHNLSVCEVCGSVSESYLTDEDDEVEICLNCLDYRANKDD